MNTVKKNIIANYIGKLWSFISIYLFVPIYLRILGIESYGIINFYSVLLTLLFFADAGLSATLNRETARSEDDNYLANMLKTIERMYWLVALFVFLFVFFISNFLAKNWLNSNTIPFDEISVVLKLMGLSISFHLLANLYFNGLMGMQRQILANSLQIFNGVCRSGIVIVPLLFCPSIKLYFIWQVISNMLYFIIIRFKMWSYIHPTMPAKFDFKIIKSLWGFTLGMMGMAIISGVNTQVDKLVVSKLLPLAQYGQYALGGIFGQLASMLTLPIAITILPTMVKLASKNLSKELKVIFHNYSFIIAMFSSTITMLIFLYTKDFILIWTNDLSIAYNINFVTKVLLLGGMFLSFQYMPYHLAIANGHTKTNLGLGIVSIIVIMPILYFSVLKFGMLGASFSWLILNIVATYYLGKKIINKFLNGSFNKWLLFDITLPLIISFITGYLGYRLTINLEHGYYVLLYSSIFGSINLLIGFYIYAKFYLKKSFVEIINYNAKRK